MNATQIDEFFQAYKNNDFRTIVELADLSQDGITDYKEFAIQNEDKILQIIEQKIKNGDYNYFLEKVNDKENLDLFVFLLIKINDTENIKRLIIEREGKNFTNKQVYDLITSIYTIDDIFDNYKLREDKFKQKTVLENELLKVEMARKINDYEYLEKYIQEKIIMGTAEADFLIDLIIDTNDYEFILDKYLNPPKVHFDDTDNEIWQGLFEYNIANKAKELIEAKLSDQDISINKGTNANILTLTQDVDYIQEIITNSNKREKLKLNSIDTLTVISI